MRLGRRHTNDHRGDGKWRSRVSRVRRGATTRVRLLGLFIVIMAVALIVGLLVQRTVLLRQLAEDVDAELRQEVEEIELLSSGSNPETGEPFGDDIASIFDTFLGGNVPSQSEGVYTLIDGQPYASSPAPHQLLADAALVERWAALTAPEEDETETVAGRVRYLAVPVVLDGEVRGTFIAAVFLRDGTDAVTDVIRTGAITYGVAFALAAALARFAAGPIRQPLNDLTDAARTVSESNWRERIYVEGDDQIAFLARTFNEMLDRLQHAFDAQRQLIDDAGHELRTPITVVRGHLELMSDDPEDRAETLRIVVDELDRMGRMVEDLLLLARAEQASFLHLQPVDIDDLMDDIVAKARMFEDRGWVVIERAPVVAIADEQRLTQALMNLCRNAVEHTPAGTTVSLGSRAAGEWLYLWVEDDGPGIAPEDQARIFERFARALDVGARGEGAGLGLAIARVIAEAHGGWIAVESEPGEGARFVLAIPVEPPDPLDPDGLLADEGVE